jgi:nucleotide-binding universal stress UspA family protein
MAPGPGPERILLPFDGSRAAECALHHAIAKSKPGRVRIDVVNVQPPVMAGDVTLLTSAGTVEERRRQLGMALLKRATSALRAQRVPHTAHVVFGDAAEEIAKSAKRFGCTKIVMGTRAMGVVRSLFSHSVARRVVTLTKVPVTLVKADAAAPEERPAVPAIPA